MGINQSSSESATRTADLFSAVLAGFGIWTKPSPVTKLQAVTQPKLSNVFPLRVIRVKEVNPQLAGRMVISGRMADVCAELDRLAA